MKIIDNLNIANGRLLINTAAVLIVLSAGIYVLDVNRALFLWLQSWGRYIPESFWASITLMGDAWTVCVLLLLFAGKYPKVVWGGVLAALFTTVVVLSLKHSLVLPRPPLIIPPEELMLIGTLRFHQGTQPPYGSSSPSGCLASIIGRQRWHY